MNSFLIAYTVIASFVSAYVYYRGVLLRPHVGVFTGADHLMLALAALAVGLLWVFFTPGMLAAGGIQLRRWVQANSSHVHLGRPGHAGIGSRV